MVQAKIEFKKVRGFKRQNSYIPQLDEFGDIDDADNLKENMVKMRRSIDHGKKREIFNTQVKDVPLHRLEKDIMAQSVSDSMHTGMQDSRGFGGLGGGGQSRKKNASHLRKLAAGTGTNFNSTGFGVNGEMLGTVDALGTPGTSPTNGSPNVVMMPAGPAKLDSQERRKLIKEIREEIKPLCSQIADFQIEKANQVIKVQIRKLENEMVNENQKLHDKVAREVKSTQEKAVNELRLVERDIKETIRSF